MGPRRGPRRRRHDPCGRLPRGPLRRRHRRGDPAPVGPQRRGGHPDALRWGAGGPGTTSISSPESGGTYIGPDPIDPNEPPPSEPPPATPPPPPAAGPSSITPSPKGDGDITPPPTSSAPSTTVSAVPSEAPPRTAAADPVTSWPEPDQRGVSTAPAGGLVRTSDERTPAPVAPIALALLVITIVAAGFAWLSRRTPPRSWACRHLPSDWRQYRNALWGDLTLMAYAWTDLSRVIVGRPTKHRQVTSGRGSALAPPGGWGHEHAD